MQFKVNQLEPESIQYENTFTNWIFAVNATSWALFIARTIFKTIDIFSIALWLTTSKINLGSLSFKLIKANLLSSHVSIQIEKFSMQTDSHWAFNRWSGHCALIIVKAKEKLENLIFKNGIWLFWVQKVIVKVFHTSNSHQIFLMVVIKWPDLTYYCNIYGQCRTKNARRQNLGKRFVAIPSNTQTRNFIGRGSIVYYRLSIDPAQSVSYNPVLDKIFLNNNRKNNLRSKAKKDMTDKRHSGYVYYLILFYLLYFK